MSICFAFANSFVFSVIHLLIDRPICNLSPWLWQSQDNDSDIKIADFGFAKKCLTPNSLKTQCGTPGYVAPEILEGQQYDTQADMWSLGVIVYILLGGYPPFIEQNQRDLFRKIRKGDYEFHEEYWGQVSEDAKTMISSLLTVNPSKRLTAEATLKNRWMTQADAALAGKDLGANLEKFKAFNAKRKFKAAVKTVIATNKFQSLGLNFQNDLKGWNSDASYKAFLFDDSVVVCVFFFCFGEAFGSIWRVQQRRDKLYEFQVLKSG